MHHLSKKQSGLQVYRLEDGKLTQCRLLHRELAQPSDDPTQVPTRRLRRARRARPKPARLPASRRQPPPRRHVSRSDPSSTRPNPAETQQPDDATEARAAPRRREPPARRSRAPPEDAKPERCNRSRRSAPGSADRSSASAGRARPGQTLQIPRGNATQSPTRQTATAEAPPAVRITAESVRSQTPQSEPRRRHPIQSPARTAPTPDRSRPRRGATSPPKRSQTARVRPAATARPSREAEPHPIQTRSAPKPDAAQTEPAALQPQAPGLRKPAGSRSTSDRPQADQPAPRQLSRQSPTLRQPIPTRRRPQRVRFEDQPHAATHLTSRSAEHPASRRTSSLGSPSRRPPVPDVNMPQFRAISRFGTLVKPHKRENPANSCNKANIDRLC